jgi:hypothetical protein
LKSILRMRDYSFQLQNATRITNAARQKLHAVSQANPTCSRQSFITAEAAPLHKAVLISPRVPSARF